MTNEEIFAHVDHTALKAVTNWNEIRVLCEEALKFKTASVCIPPAYVERAHREFSTLTLCTVIGFPLGYNTTACKTAEARDAIAHGAAEIDMVVNLCDVKNGDFEKVTAEITALREVCERAILKVIIETCYLTESEKIALCGAVTRAGADYIKTSTGFGTGGAAHDDILLFKKHIGSAVKIKASGGIKTRDEMERYLAEGCDRIGTSSAVSVLSGGGL